jgi:hypothetical protein
MPATDAGETSGICNLRPQPISPEDTIYIDACRESLKQYINMNLFVKIVYYATRKKERKKERRKVNTTVMEHFNSILFHKSGLANKATRRTILQDDDDDNLYYYIKL